MDSDAVVRNRAWRSHGLRHRCISAVSGYRRPGPALAGPLRRQVDLRHLTAIPFVAFLTVTRRRSLNSFRQPWHLSGRMPTWTRFRRMRSVTFVSTRPSMSSSWASAWRVSLLSWGGGGPVGGGWGWEHG